MDEVRDVMGAASNALELEENQQKVEQRRALAQREVQVKQRVRGTYLDAEKAKLKMKATASRQGRPVQTVDRVDLDLERQVQMRTIRRPRRERRRHRVLWRSDEGAGPSGAQAPTAPAPAAAKPRGT